MKTKEIAGILPRTLARAGERRVMAAPVFNETIADLLPSLKWRHFGVGALQAYLHEGGGIEQRLHIWSDSLVKPGISGFGDAHNHRFSFVSQVLCGTIVNQRIRVTEELTGDFDLYEVENARAAHARAGTHDGRCVVVARARAAFMPAVSISAGDSYEFPRGDYHCSRFIGTTVTLVTKFDQRDEPALILCPHGEDLVHAFGGTAPDIPAILDEAAEALRVKPAARGSFDDYTED